MATGWPRPARFLRQLGRELDDRALQIASLHFVEVADPGRGIGAVVGLSRKWVGHELARVRALAERLGREPAQRGQREPNG